MMRPEIENISGVKVGVLPTHTKFVGGVAPEAGGKLPRNLNGQLVMLAELKEIIAQSPVSVDATEISLFPGTDERDLDELFKGILGVGLELQTVLMVGGVNPWNPEDECAVVAQLVSGLLIAQKYGVKTVASTSFEEWMSGRAPLEGEAYTQAVHQLAKVHQRAYNEAKVADSSILTWNLEFLRGGEFTTFTSIVKAAPVVSEINALLGQPVMKLMVDAAHCGDSELTMQEHERLIKTLAVRDELGVFHASAKTTRGCLNSDDGWIPALLSAAAQTGQLKEVFVEIFHHEDEALQALRDLDAGHGVDTTDGRSYTETVVEGLVNITRRLNSLKARGFL